MTDWLSRFGTARITLGVDEDFSLKNSQFDFLHPWYETPDNLFFSQHTLHRTDERTQINNGLGWRHFTPTWMSGINFFFDHDLKRRNELWWGANSRYNAGGRPGRRLAVRP